jgi:hypothetical protein
MPIKQSTAVMCPSQFHLFFLTSLDIIYRSNYFQKNNIIRVIHKNNQISQLMVHSMLLNDLQLGSIKERTTKEIFVIHIHRY